MTGSLRAFDFLANIQVVSIPAIDLQRQKIISTNCISIAKL